MLNAKVEVIGPCLFARTQYMGAARRSLTFKCAATESQTIATIATKCAKLDPDGDRFIPQKTTLRIASVELSPLDIALRFAFANFFDGADCNYAKTRRHSFVVPARWLRLSACFFSPFTSMDEFFRRSYFYKQKLLNINVVILISIEDIHI